MLVIHYLHILNIYDIIKNNYINLIKLYPGPAGTQKDEKISFPKHALI